MIAQKSAIGQALATGGLPTWGDIDWFPFQNNAGAPIVKAPAVEDKVISGGSATDTKLTRLTGVTYDHSHTTGAFGDLLAFLAYCMYGGSTVVQDAALDAYQHTMTTGIAPKKVVLRDRMETGARAFAYYKAVVSSLELKGANNGIPDLSFGVLSSAIKRNQTDVSDTYPALSTCLEVLPSTESAKTVIDFLPAGGSVGIDEYHLTEKIARGFTYRIDNGARQGTPIIENAPMSGVPLTDTIKTELLVDADFGNIDPDSPEKQLLVWAEGGDKDDTEFDDDGIASTGSMEGTLTFKCFSRATIDTGGAYYYGVEFSTASKITLPNLSGRVKGADLTGEIAFNMTAEPAPKFYTSQATFPTPS